MFSPRYEAALALAARRHDGQRRKGGDLPYLTHLVHVGRILEPYGEDAVIAGLLHDLLEDTCKTHDEIEEVSRTIESTFGARVLAAVRSVSETKFASDGTKIRWRERKERYIAHLAEASELALLVSAADKIHNVATLVQELESRGPEVWARFKAGAEESLWFYQEVAKTIARRLGDDHALSTALREQIDTLSERI